MSFRKMLQQQGTVRGRRWIIKRTKDDKIREIKMIFNPQEYQLNNKNNRVLYGDKALLKILTKEYKNQ